MRGGGPVRESDVLVGATLPAKKGQVFLVGFIWGNVTLHDDLLPFAACGSTTFSEVRGKIVNL